MKPEHDALDIAAQIDELKLLTDGWLDGRGKAPDPGGLDWARELLETHLPDHVQLPHLYPTPDGGIQAEWNLHGIEISLELDLTERSGDWHEYDSTPGAEVTETLDFREPGAISWVVSRLEELQHET
jgi:hypothetical protein